MPNPFHNGQEKLPLSHFYGREGLRQKLKSLIENDWFANLIEGDRGYGKTSILSWLTEMYSADPSVLICPIDFATFRPGGNSDFYEELIHRTSDAFAMGLAEKSKKGAITDAVVTALRKIKVKIPIPFTDGVEISSSPTNPHPASIVDLLHAIYDGAAGHGVKSIVFVLDEISSRANEGTSKAGLWAWEYCSDLASQLVHFSPRRPDTHMGIVMMAYPRDFQRVSIQFSPSRHLEEVDFLKPFDRTEVRALIEKLCNSQGVPFQDSFPSLVYNLSGGSPDLVQAVGYGAYRHAETHRPGTQVDLREEDATYAHVVHSKIVQKARALVQWKLPQIYDLINGGSAGNVALRIALTRLGELPLTKVNRLTRDKWADLACKEDHSGRQLFAEFFDAGVAQGLIISDDEGEKYSFLGEMCRHAVSQIAQTS